MSDSSILPSSAADASDGERVFIDADGAKWRVYEKPNSDYDRRHGSSLIFASEAAVRRVRQFPTDWRTLSVEALARLSWMP